MCYHYYPSNPLPDYIQGAPQAPTRAFHWFLFRHCPGSLCFAIPLGQPLSKHLRLEDFKLGPFLCLGEHARGDQTALTHPPCDRTPKRRPLTVISPFFLASFINFFLFFFPLRAKSNSCRALATGMRRQHFQGPLKSHFKIYHQKDYYFKLVRNNLK